MPADSGAIGRRLGADLIANGGRDLFGLAVAPSGTNIYFVDDAGSGRASNSLALGWAAAGQHVNEFAVHRLNEPDALAAIARRHGVGQPVTSTRVIAERLPDDRFEFESDVRLDSLTRAWLANHSCFHELSRGLGRSAIGPCLSSTAGAPSMIAFSASGLSAREVHPGQRQQLAIGRETVLHRRGGPASPLRLSSTVDGLWERRRFQRGERLLRPLRRLRDATPRTASLRSGGRRRSVPV